MQISEEINNDLDGFQLVHCLYFRVYLLQQMCLFWKNAYQLWTKSYAIIQEKHGTQFWYEKQKVFFVFHKYYIKIPCLIHPNASNFEKNKDPGVNT